MENNFNKSKQYILQFSTRTDMDEENFMVTSCNEIAYRTIKIWPYWQHFALSLFGPQSSGKTHLAHIWANHIEKSLPRPIQIPFLSAHSINMKNINKIANENPYLVIEDVDSDINEEAFFHLYNFYNVPERFILFTSSVPLTKLPIKLPDLHSRLNSVPNVEILSPDDTMLTALIAKQFNDRQIIISQEILDYILKHSERSFDFISKLINEIDEVSLIYHRAVSIPIVREALNNLSKNKQLELFI